MTVYEDGTEVPDDGYAEAGGPAAGSLAFGWLGPGDLGPPRQCPDSLLRVLEDAARSPVGRTRGFHRCPFCPDAEFWLTRHQTTDGSELWLGSAAIEVRDMSGRTWQAPNLVLHYVTAHGYLPPAPLVETYGTVR